MQSVFEKQLESHAIDLGSAVQVLADQCRDAGIGASDCSTNGATPESRTRTVGSILATVGHLQTLLFQLEPTLFLQQLASQNQLLACLQWLGEFQVLAFVPLGANCSVPIKDVADLADVPEAHLSRVVRIMAIAGFLREPQPGHIEHTALSASFVTRPAHLDAAMFLAETIAPSALHMAAASRQHSTARAFGFGADGSACDAGDSAYTLATRGSPTEDSTFQLAFERRKRLQRQWPAYLNSVGDTDDAAAELLGQLDWIGLGNSCVVDVGGPIPGRTNTGNRCAIQALADLYPALSFAVQTEDPSAPISPSFPDPGRRISVHKRPNGAPQTIKDAAVYMVRLSTSSSPPIVPIRERILSELRSHLRVLEGNRSALLILTPRLLPDPGSVDVQVESMARLRDLSLLQLANERDLNMQELMDLVDSVHDANGRLVVIKQLRSRNSSVVALGIRYQSHSERPLNAA
ncbi:hypothetical protein BU24DRAFT_420072 [Aaosphaeria arxii CBS 175.79]|uniref:O-methyltransferase family protein n=1 Tax=Aaosphaeria arxii CBS 175.79 TaxID=1450172 RepID=A0A6A5XW35_9PLEO|nr:uncharacterized protein BU24DRAFT_420072 [Aaosphaeria arxii CBS 175.79]KAF2017047.1 hypothetical protein BU24DRAFT_420072 [Aaosphaeria arxii CBS 175.79]